MQYNAGDAMCGVDNDRRIHYRTRCHVANSPRCPRRTPTGLELLAFDQGSGSAPAPPPRCAATTATVPARVSGVVGGGAAQCGSNAATYLVLDAADVGACISVAEAQRRGLGAMLAGSSSGSSSSSSSNNTGSFRVCCSPTTGGNISIYRYIDTSCTETTANFDRASSHVFVGSGACVDDSALGLVYSATCAVPAAAACDDIAGPAPEPEPELNEAVPPPPPPLQPSQVSVAQGMGAEGGGGSVGVLGMVGILVGLVIVGIGVCALCWPKIKQRCGVGSMSRVMGLDGKYMQGEDDDVEAAKAVAASAAKVELARQRRVSLVQVAAEKATKAARKAGT
eukprot:SAG31_NODE_9465_length_1273_cov_1.367121_1_plen_337_part_10